MDNFFSESPNPRLAPAQYFRQHRIAITRNRRPQQPQTLNGKTGIRRTRRLPRGINGGRPDMIRLHPE
jgi:hypothetical protein